MAPSRFPIWLRHCGDLLTTRCAGVLERRRMRRAQAQLDPAVRQSAAFWRARYLAREARLQRERDQRIALRGSSNELAASTLVPTISKADVMAAVARSRANREARLKASREDRESR